MIAEGLLWFDDDPRRPLVEKIAHAVERYAERTGWRATVCEAHPALVEAYRAEAARAANAVARRRSAAKPAAPAVTLPPRLRVAPNASMQPNCFLIGIEAGETPRRAPAPVSGHVAARRARAKVERVAERVAPGAAPATPAARATPATTGAPASAGRASRARTPRAKAS
ncbi:MAG TPA: hypothetical protein VFU60_00850 [Ktedonobacterales bacterium]|nr:hypothetical protein [Ktedonobacterales bacterium]